MGSEAASPFADRDLREAQVRGDLLIGLTPSSRQHNTAAQSQTLRRGRSFHPSLQLLFLHGIEGNVRGDSRHAPSLTARGLYYKELFVRCTRRCFARRFGTGLADSSNRFSL